MSGSHLKGSEELRLHQDAKEFVVPLESIVLLHCSRLLENLLPSGQVTWTESLSQICTHNSGIEARNQCYCSWSNGRCHILLFEFCFCSERQSQEMKLTTAKRAWKKCRTLYFEQTLIFCVSTLTKTTPRPRPKPRTSTSNLDLYRKYFLSTPQESCICIQEMS